MKNSLEKKYLFFWNIRNPGLKFLLAILLKGFNHGDKYGSGAILFLKKQFLYRKLKEKYT